MFESIKNKKFLLGTELINRGLITQEQLDEALAYQRNHPDLKIGEVVDILNMCDKAQLLNVIINSIKYMVDLYTKTINK